MLSLLHQQERQTFHYHQRVTPDQSSIEQAYQKIPLACIILAAHQYNITPVILREYL